MIYSFYISLTEWDFIGTPRFIGLKNYMDIMKDSTAKKALINTACLLYTSNRRKPAGVRTHTVVGVASALMMLISKYGFNDVLNEYTKLDPSRVAAGVVTAIGFLGSGMIIARNKSVSGITTSAGIWATAVSYTHLANGIVVMTHKVGGFVVEDNEIIGF